MAAIAAGFVVVLDAGFHLHHQPAPAGFDLATPAAAVILFAAIVIGVRLIWRGLAYRTRNPLSPRRLAQLKAERVAVAQARRQRLAELAADPRRAAYVALIEGGQAWSDAQIAYDLDRAALATCTHLKPVEAAIRLSGVAVKLEVAPNITARCVLDYQAAQRRFTLAHCVKFTERSMGGRDYEDGLFAMLRCAVCESRIDFTHRHQPGQTDPVFPSG